MSRDVYVWTPDPTLVLKLEVGYKHQNVIEYETWWELKDTPAEKWLAPCVWMSHCGQALLMKRTEPMRSSDDVERMPVWLSDHKRQNYGIYDGRLVCHDYGTNLLMYRGAQMKATHKVTWRDC